MEVILHSHENESSGQGSGELLLFMAVDDGFGRPAGDSGSSTKEDSSRELSRSPVGYSDVNANVSSVGHANITSSFAEIKEQIATVDIEKGDDFNWVVLVAILGVFLLLILVLLIVAAIWRNRGGKYAVHEKEKLRGNEPHREDDDAEFGEYVKTPLKEPLDSSEPRRQSQESAQSDEKLLDGGNDTDSLGDYEDSDPSKFNEDGSFIGQYGRIKKTDELIDQSFQLDETAPAPAAAAALSTVV